MPNDARYFVSADTALPLAPYLAANWLTESKLVKPPVTADLSWDMLFSFKMKETCSGVSGAVVPNADAPGTADARKPVGIFSEVEAWAEPAVAATEPATTSTPAASPAHKRGRTKRTMLGARS